MFGIRRFTDNLSFLRVPALLVIITAVSWLLGTGSFDRVISTLSNITAVILTVLLFFFPLVVGWSLSRLGRFSYNGQRIDAGIRDTLERIPWIGTRIHGLHWLIAAVLLSWATYEATYWFVRTFATTYVVYAGRWQFWENTSIHAQSCVAGLMFLFSMLVEPLLISFGIWWHEPDKFSVPLGLAMSTPGFTIRKAQQGGRLFNQLLAYFPTRRVQKWATNLGVYFSQNKFVLEEEQS